MWQVSASVTKTNVERPLIIAETAEETTAISLKDIAEAEQIQEKGRQAK
jgi:hypothetical protein